jgi:uncharacterized membrane protein YfcA
MPAAPLSFAPALQQQAWLITASFLAGVLNAVAGGGSFLSFPALLGMGVLPIPANATNTVALWPGQLTSIAAYRTDLDGQLRLLVPVSVSALLGGLAGAIVLLHTGQGTFLRLIPWLLLVASLLFAASGRISRWIAVRRAQSTTPQSTTPQSTTPQSTGIQSTGISPARYLPLCLALLVVCFYIGYFGAGAGFLIMAALAIFGIDSIRQVNALKVVATTIANGIAVVTFMVGRQVLWQYCLLMMVSGAAGGYLGGRYSRRLDAAVMRIFVVVIGLGMAAYFFLRT